MGYGEKETMGHRGHNVTILSQKESESMRHVPQMQQHVYSATPFIGTQQ